MKTFSKNNDDKSEHYLTSLPWLLYECIDRTVIEITLHTEQCCHRMQAAKGYSEGVFELVQLMFTCYVFFQNSVFWHELSRQE